MQHVCTVRQSGNRSQKVLFFPSVWITRFADARTKVCIQAVEGLGRLDESYAGFRSEVSGFSWAMDLFLTSTAANKLATADLSALACHEDGPPEENPICE